MLGWWEIPVGTTGGIPTLVQYASNFLAPPLTANTLVIGVTQSGETADTLAAQWKTASVRSAASVSAYWALPIN